MIRIALPNKGRLAEPTRELLRTAGLAFSSTGSRALQAQLGDDFLALFVRANDIPEFVADGAADLGVTGSDLVSESGRELQSLLGLGFGRCRLVVAARDDASVTAVEDIADGTPVATSFPRITERYFAERGRRMALVPVSGAAEIAPHIGVADVIVDLVSTGSTLKMNGLRELATVAASEATLIARPGMADGERRDDIRALRDALESVVRARGKRYLMANVPRDQVERLHEVLPGLSGPTIVDVLNGGDVVAAHAVVDEDRVYRIVTDLRELGATGILITRIERLAP